MLTACAQGADEGRPLGLELQTTGQQVVLCLTYLGTCGAGVGPGPLGWHTLRHLPQLGQGHRTASAIAAQLLLEERWCFQKLLCMPLPEPAVRLTSMGAPGTPEGAVPVLPRHTTHGSWQSMC